MTNTTYATLKAEFILGEDIYHPAFNMPNWVSKAEYDQLSNTAKSYYVIN